MMDGPRTSCGSQTSCAVYSEEHSRWYAPCIVFVLNITSNLKQVQMSIEAHFVSDILRGNDTTEMRVTLLRMIEDEMPPEDD